MLFYQIAIITFLAAALGIILEKLRQPTILGYLLAGILAAWWGVVQGEEQLEVINSLGKIGVVLLLFLVGMELSIPKVKSVGRTAVVLGIGQILFTTGVGWLLVRMWGYDWLGALYLSIGLAFSSTIIIIKLLGEKKTLDTLHGRIAVGFLLVQDLAAILILVTLSAVGEGNLGWSSMFLVGLKVLIMIALVWWLSYYIVPRMVDMFSPSPELLFLSSVAWGLGIAALMIWDKIGFTLETGGFLAGVTLANTNQHHEIVSRLRPLRDFFIMLFFVVLAIDMVSQPLTGSFNFVLVMSLFVLLGNPLIVMLLMRQMGYRSKIGFMVSLTVAQVSEFSLILVALGEDLGHLPKGTLGLMALIAVITMTLSTYLIWGSDKIWQKLGGYLRQWEKTDLRGLSVIDDNRWDGHIVLFGCDRSGRVILNHLRKYRDRILVVDYNPEIVEALQADGYEVVYGDMDDVDIFDSIKLNRARLVISTVTDWQASVTLLEYLSNHQARRGQIVMLTAAYPRQAKGLFDKGADYVAVPKWLNGVHVASLASLSLVKGKQYLHQRAEKELARMLAVS